MTTHAGLPVAGYQPQTDDKVQVVNRAKELEERVLRHLDALASDKANDQRMVSIARTGIQEASSFVVRHQRTPISTPSRLAAKPLRCELKTSRRQQRLSKNRSDE